MWRSASYVTMSKRCGHARAAEVFDEVSVNTDQNALYRRELPPW